MEEWSCPECGATIPADAPAVQCPACMTQPGLGDAGFVRAEGERTTEAAADDALELPTFGPYRAVRLLGSGGMGLVYLAEQIVPVRRSVALKVVKPGIDSKQVLARFESERQALALLQHPAIAAIYDAGTTPQGQPFFAMEYVPGSPINRYCDRHRLSVGDRVELFLQVCGAVQHAHQKGIIHRDLTPSNLLVMRQDDRPLVKVIDFGIAKAVAQRLTERTLFTQHGAFVGTPAYMSPEQAGATEFDVDTRTDIYSLGVVLYELLAGSRPFEEETLRDAALGEMLRVIRDVTPPRLTARFSGVGDAAALEIAKRRQADVRSLARQLRGDLEWITLRSLEKEPARRYGTASELASDLRRHLASEPVSAGPPRLSYRAGKFVRKHKAAVGAAVAILIALAIGLVTSLTLYLRANEAMARAQHERDNAMRQLSYAESSNEFVTFLLDQGGSGKPFTMTELLTQGEELVTKQFADDPATRARLQMHLSGLYAQGGQGDKAGALLEQAQRAAQVVDDPTLHATIECGLAWQVSEKGSADAAIRMVDSALARLNAAAEHETGKSAHAECLFARGQVRFARGDAQASTADLQQALAVLGRPRTDQRTLAIRIRSTLALALHRAGQPAPAIAEYQRVVAELDAMGRGRTRLVASLLNNLGVLLNASGQTLRASQASERALDIVRGVGATDPVLEAVYAKLLTQLGRAREALPLAEQAISRAREAGNERVRVIAAQNGAVTLCAVGDLARCGVLLNEARDGLARTMAKGSTAIAGLQVQQAELALARSDPRQAVRVLQEALGVLGGRPATDVNAIQALTLLARAEQLLGELPAAQLHAEQAVDRARKAKAGFEHSRWLGTALVAQGLVQRARGDAEAAGASWRAALVELQASDGDAAPPTEEVRRLLAGA